MRTSTRSVAIIAALSVGSVGAVGSVGSVSALTATAAAVDAPNPAVGPPRAAVGAEPGPAATGDETADRPQGTPQVWGTGGPYAARRIPADLDEVVAVDLHHYSFAAVRADGSGAAWNAVPDEHGSGQWAAAFTDLVDLAAGGGHFVALRSDGTVEAHGPNDHGQSDAPTGLTDVTAVAAGDAFSLALRADGTVVAWGADADGESSVPTGLTDAVAIDAGRDHALAVRADGTVVGWGRDDWGQARPPAGLDDVVTVSAGRDHSLALRADGTVVAWGRDHRGVLDVPADLDDAVAVGAGAEHNLALRGDGTVVAWGNDELGRGVGTGYGGTTSIPKGLIGVLDLAVGTSQNLVLVADGVPSPLPDTTPPVITTKGNIVKAATSARGARIWYQYTVHDDVFEDVDVSSDWDGPGSWSSLGRRSVDVVAMDWAGNSTHVWYYHIVRWSWSGLQAPIEASGTTELEQGTTVPLRFRLTRGSTGATDAVALVSYAPVVDGVVGSYTDADGAGTSTNRFRHAGGTYRFDWVTEDLAPGTYSLRVDLGDDVDRTVLVELVAAETT